MRKHNKITSSMAKIHLHFVFCPRYRRKVFSAIDGFEARFIELARQICEQKRYEILDLECGEDYVHIYLGIGPDDRPSDAVRDVKLYTSRTLLQEYSDVIKTNSLWTMDFMVSSDKVLTDAAIQRFVATQKKSGAPERERKRSKKS